MSIINNLYSYPKRSRPVYVLLIILLLGTAPAFAQKNPPAPSSTPPPPPPPPPPPATRPEAYTGPGSTLSANTLKRIETLKSLFGQRLRSLNFNGNKENDYLVKVMQLNYSAIHNVANADLGIAATNIELSKQTDIFLEANGLLSTPSKEDSAAGVAVLENSMQIKELNSIKDELVKLSQEYKNSGIDAAVLRFAEKIIKQNGKKEEDVK